MSEWKETTLEEVIDIQNGYAFKSEDFDAEGIPVIKIKNIASGKLLLDDVQFYSKPLIGLDKFIVSKNDILIAMTGSHVTQISSAVGKVTKYDSTQKSLLNQRVGKIYSVNINKLNNDFLYYFLIQPTTQYQLGLKASGSANQANISPSNIKELPILLPSIKEQKQIIYVLTCLDAKIENLRRQNETLEAIAQTLFKHWFIDFEFPNADGKPYKSSGGGMWRSAIGDIPEGWQAGNLGDVVDVNSQSIDKNYPHKVIEYVDISSVGIGISENTTQYKLSEAPSRARRLVKHGDVIWSGVRPNRKSYLFICNPIDNLVVSTGFIVLSPKQIPSSYLYAWVTTSMFVDYLTLNASGSAYPAVKAEHFEIAEIILPSKAILGMFHSIVDPMRIKTHENSLQIQTLTKTRDALLPKLMSGQLRVKE